MKFYGKITRLNPVKISYVKMYSLNLTWVFLVFKVAKFLMMIL